MYLNNVYFVNNVYSISFYKERKNIQISTVSKASLWLFYRTLLYIY